ncbi:hypothetical protein GCM10010121_089460 [Streptomyces brasiliensis]|uniref:Uncharacterized protein n=1 Tax=Streptomyces brasiliensis TaxID=1954 RepID=A0A917P770_9ACTN|nr:hypothetical protein GCM10010121_089460 [Streptomyces brasiliensis]
MVEVGAREDLAAEATELRGGGIGRERLGRRQAWLSLTGGAALFATWLLALHYPASMVSVPGASRTTPTRRPCCSWRSRPPSPVRRP